MRKLLSGLCATTLAASFAIASAVPVNAVPLIVPQAPVAQSDIIKVQSRGREVMEERWLRRQFRGNRREFRREFRGDRREFRRDRRDFRRSIRRDRDDRYGWYRGHRGYRSYRPGYRRHGDFWFPAAAFITGAIIGGALSSPPRRVYGGNAHVQWCYDRYRSYRAWDNTFQPYNGPRRQCYSPYS
ncbi:BA14K family protein [Allomesorhizobium camelthorni]|uniref:Lectin-like protein BA14k n=1 Tax=Allomesorhizobium camelthorni TaxID=475069 RepID=A0A6G4WDE4_9HYPH|nr:BA14K family protein [Mesorhizobium camelthorni]NGO52358.1 BA14K family protein [Mesorhizobium camelthorni]